MKLVLKEPGFEKYNGQFGVLNFIEGTSDDDVSRLDAVRISAVMKCEWADGRIPTLGTEFGELLAMSAPIINSGCETEVPVDAPPAEQLPGELEAKTPAAAELAATRYTEDDLGKIADTKGAAGLRAVAKSFNVSGKTVAELITGVINAQAANDAKSKVE